MWYMFAYSFSRVFSTTLRAWIPCISAYLNFSSSVWNMHILKYAPKKRIYYFKELRKKLQVNINWNVLFSDNAKKTKHQGFPGKSYKVKLTELWHFFIFICFSMNLGSTEQVFVKLKPHAAVELLREHKNVTGFLALEVLMLVNPFFLFLCPGWCWARYGQTLWKWLQPNYHLSLWSLEPQL